MIPVSFFQWHVKNDLDTDRLGRDATGQPQRLASEGFDRAFGRGINVSPRLNWKLGDDESLTLQGFFITNRFFNDGTNNTEVLASNASSVLPQSVLDETHNRGTFSAQRVNLQYNNRFDEDRRIELRAGAGTGGNMIDFNFDSTAMTAPVPDAAAAPEMPSAVHSARREEKPA